MRFAPSVWKLEDLDIDRFMRRHLEQFEYLKDGYEVFWYGGRIYCIIWWKRAFVRITDFSRTNGHHLLKHLCMQNGINFEALERQMSE